MNKGEKMMFKSLLLVTFFLGCSSLPRGFTTENIMKIKQGMSSEEIHKMFGDPKNISQSICGANTGKVWTCTTWEYGTFLHGNATFTFSGEPGSYILNNFEIERN